MVAPAASALDAAAAELSGQVYRTSASVIGHRDGESVIFATAGWGYTVTVMLSGMRIAFVAQTRGWLRKSLDVGGLPMALVADILDEEHQKRLLALQPITIELGPAALRLEHRYGTPADIAATIDLAVSLARRARRVEQSANEEHFGRTG